MKYSISNKEVEEYRPGKADLDPFIPYDFIHEQEIQEEGKVKSVNTIFLTNKECPFKCVMCDLWRNTIDEPTPKHAIPKQIEYALERLPPAEVVKLYNSGNFFDGKAIPRSDYKEIAALLSGFEHVIVENHPRLIGSFIPLFRDMLDGSFEIAMGLETVHPEVLPKLNKQITIENFRQAARFLNQNDISVRAFILLNPPFLKGRQENIDWCLKSVKFSFELGVSACSIIPTRDGNGIMEKLRAEGEYVPPELHSLEEVFEKALSLNMGRVFCDTWDLEKFSDCEKCIKRRKDRLHKMNLTQKVLSPVDCLCY